ncbi:hypothetical protein GCM10010420_09320 [Streptomyces glaucosporus]|uniref:Uncharacterized protein n=1 Tax=Streptomyces glaucosporus TaxID=284044 RepID=A0ABP5UVP5_9ACTN
MFSEPLATQSSLSWESPRAVCGGAAVRGPLYETFTPKSRAMPLGPDAYPWPAARNFRPPPCRGIAAKITAVPAEASSPGSRRAGSGAASGGGRRAPRGAGHVRAAASLPVRVPGAAEPPGAAHSLGTEVCGAGHCRDQMVPIGRTRRPAGVRR